MRVVVIHMGGFYEWLYHCLRSGLPFDASRELALGMGQELTCTAFELRRRFRKARNGTHLIITFKGAIKNLQKAPDCRLT